MHCWYKFELEGKADYVESSPEAECTRHNPTCETTTTYSIKEITKEVPETITVSIALNTCLLSFFFFLNIIEIAYLVFLLSISMHFGDSKFRQLYS